MMRGTAVPGGRRGKTPGTLLQEFRARWEAGKDTWNAFAGKPWQVEGGEEAPGTLSRENRGRWKAEKDTWNAFAGIPCQVDGREMPPGTLSQKYRARWTANLSDTGRDSAMKMKIMENLLLFVVNSYFRRAKKWKHANHG